MTIRRFLVAIPLMFLGWISVLLAVALVTDEAPAYVVVFPSQSLLGNLASDTSVISRSHFTVSVSSEQSGFAKSLYKKGAWFVLPAGLAGCLPMPQSTFVH
ncbi:hypothetical protein [Aliiroseovarius sp. F20344]|uniref:hypothetical protein n=1 Tax=Aliiroseovarius sp. F20344 TaxID=2926414 RepID=UPI001FF3CA28|nr:hypothetical protein [Aliiroseovarius sp. F20344]MCK0141690.1 hypothetical protein [Aliiroseovarius sp. F20344]